MHDVSASERSERVPENFAFLSLFNATCISDTFYPYILNKPLFKGHIFININIVLSLKIGGGGGREE